METGTDWCISLEEDDVLRQTVEKAITKVQPYAIYRLLNDGGALTNVVGDICANHVRNFIDGLNIDVWLSRDKKLQLFVTNKEMTDSDEDEKSFDLVDIFEGSKGYWDDAERPEIAAILRRLADAIESAPIMPCTAAPQPRR